MTSYKYFGQMALATTLLLAASAPTYAGGMPDETTITNLSYTLTEEEKLELLNDNPELLIDSELHGDPEFVDLPDDFDTDTFELLTDAPDADTVSIPEDTFDLLVEDPNLDFVLNNVTADDFVGVWENTNADISEIERVIIKSDGEKDYTILLLGTCGPMECELGSGSLRTYDDSAQGRMYPRGTAAYDTAYGEAFLTVELENSDRLKLTIFNSYLSETEFQNNVIDVSFVKGSVANLPETCMPWNLDRTSAKEFNGNWIVTGENFWIMDFGMNGADAQKTVEIMKHYGMTQSCVVGWQDGSMSYFLSEDGTAPSGSIAGEQCTSFDLDATDVALMNDRWHVVDGDRSLFDFGNKLDAEQALSVLQKHEFDHVCHMGSADEPSFSYLRS